eukprot:gene3478-3811_t
MGRSWVQNGLSEEFKANPTMSSGSLLDFTTSGENFGEVALTGSTILLSTTRGKVLEAPLENAALCVVPTNNRDELEIQFSLSDQAERKEDALVQITLHFPTVLDKSETSHAQLFHKSILDAGIIKSITGDIIAEFSKEQGNFVTPRGKYALQLTSSYFYMQGAQYAYKILYDDINSLFLLPKLDGGRIAFVISLDKAIKQGNQRYQHLVIDTHNLEQTMKINVSAEELRSKYEGQLEPELTMPLSNLIAKLFKTLSGKKVFIPKQFTSAREAFCVRCSIKANEGLLYPLAKSFIFIHKPTIIIKFEDILQVEFRRYEGVANAATRNFDLAITLKDSASATVGDTREYVFMSIDRSEYPYLSDYIRSKEIPVKNAQTKADSGSALLAELDQDEDDEEDDENYSGSESQGSEESDMSNDDDDNGDSGGKQSNRNKKPRKG